MIALKLKDGAQFVALSYFVDSVGLHFRVCDEMTVRQAADSFGDPAKAGSLVFDGDGRTVTYDGYTDLVMLNAQYDTGMGMLVISRRAKNG